MQRHIFRASSGHSLKRDRQTNSNICLLHPRETGESQQCIDCAPVGEKSTCGSLHAKYDARVCRHLRPMPPSSIPHPAPPRTIPLSPARKRQPHRPSPPGSHPPDPSQAAPRISGSFRSLAPPRTKRRDEARTQPERRYEYAQRTFVLSN